MKSKIISLLLIATLIIGLFAGCGNTQTQTPETPDETPEETPATDEVTEPTVYTTFDYNAAFDSYAPDSVVMTVNGKEVSWKEYFGWLFSIVQQYEMYLGTEFAWSDPFSETQTIEEYAKLYTETMCSQYAVVSSEAEAAGIQLSAEEEQAIDQVFAADAQSYTGGDMEAFVEFLESTFMDEDYYRFIQACAVYYQRLFENSFGADGEKLSNEDVEDFISTNGYLYAKHILFLINDETGTPLDETAKAEKLAMAENTLQQLKAISDRDELLAKFDELMNSLSEDTGLAAYPEGYYFLPGEMVIEFEEGTKALEDYEISDIIETSYGYHIILRLPIGIDDVYSDGVTFRKLAAGYAFDNVMSEKFQSAEIVYNEEFAELSLGSIMNKIEVEY